MKTLVVYESMFGNTQTVARAIAEGIAGLGPVDVQEVGSAPPLGEVDADLVVVGAPTHALSLSRASTRKSAAEQTGRAVISAHEGVREWLAGSGPVQVTFATFETHARKPNLPGSAARAAARRLRRLGGTELERPQTFWVGGLEGPLADGEVERARAWGSRLAQRLNGTAGHPLAG